MSVSRAFSVVVVCVFFAAMVSAQDAVKADPKHYSVMSENEKVRILKAHYGPHEKSVMHSHPGTVAVFLTDATAQFTFPDGKTQDLNAKAGTAQYTASMTHLPENTGEKEMDAILVELKSKPASSMKPKTK